MTDESRWISAGAQAGDQGKPHDNARLKVEHSAPGVTITLERPARKGDPTRIRLSIPEASQLIADLARAIEAEVEAREST